MVRRGEDHNQARLTVEQVIRIRRFRAGGVPLKALARQFGVSLDTISDIARRKTWRHLP